MLLFLGGFSISKSTLPKIAGAVVSIMFACRGKCPILNKCSCFCFYGPFLVLEEGPYLFSRGGEVMPSKKILEQKKNLVQELSDRLSNSCAGVLVNYKGINVEDDTKLRQDLRQAGVKYTVVKNTMLSRAIKDTDLESMSEVLTDTTALATSDSDHVAAARILCEFASENKYFKIKSGFLNGNVISESKVHELSKLPSKDVLVAQVLSGLNSPIAGFAGVLSGLQRGLVCALNEIAQKQGA